MNQQDSVWSNEELSAIYEALCDGEGRDVSDDEVKGFLRWAHQARTQAAIVQHVVEGRFLVRQDKGEFSFRLREGAVPPSGD